MLRISTIGLLVFLFLLSYESVAKRRVALLKFGGPYAQSARAKLYRALKRQYKILSANAVPNACANLGVPMTKGDNLAQGAQAVGAVAVIGGATSRRKLTLVIFSGKTGLPIKTGSVRWSARPKRKMLRRALALIRKGVAKAPRRLSSPRRRDTTPPPATDTELPDTPPSDDPGLSFDPNDVGSSKTAPPKTDDSGYADNPLADVKIGKDGRYVDSDQNSTLEREEKAEEDEKNARTAQPKLFLNAALGLLFRNYTTSDPIEPRWNKVYSSGASFAIKLSVDIRPAAYFIDNFAENIFMRMEYLSVIGLTSSFSAATAGTEPASLSTSIGEFNLDIGYRWLLGAWLKDFVFDFFTGYGNTSFSIDWKTTAVSQQVPSASYSYLKLGSNAAYPAFELLDHQLTLVPYLNVEYRFLLGVGDIEAFAEPGFGPTTGGGLAFSLGTRAYYGRWIAGLSYQYTRYFLTFSDAESRYLNGLPSAAGALDQYHMILIEGGASF